MVDSSLYGNDQGDIQRQERKANVPYELDHRRLAAGQNRSSANDRFQVVHQNMSTHTGVRLATAARR